MGFYRGFLRVFERIRTRPERRFCHAGTGGQALFALCNLLVIFGWQNDAVICAYKSCQGKRMGRIKIREFVKTKRQTSSTPLNPELESMFNRYYVSKKDNKFIGYNVTECLQYISSLAKLIGTGYCHRDRPF
jgi:ribosome biogenesis protein Tsr3